MKQLIDKDALVAEIEKLKGKVDDGSSYFNGWQQALRMLEMELATLETKDVGFERELGKYVSEGIHRFFPGEENDYCTMDSVIWQDYVIETAEHFYELGLKAQKGE